MKLLFSFVHHHHQITKLSHSINAIGPLLFSFVVLLPGGRRTKPSGGGVGALLRDTLLGPKLDQ
jgi:hypothetical protein